jgi:hypothetical protein
MVTHATESREDLPAYAFSNFFNNWLILYCWVKIQKITAATTVGNQDTKD